MCRQAIESAVTLVKERATRHGMQLSLEMDKRLNEFTGDERKFKQVLLNLLSNAVKFTPEGGSDNVSAKATNDGLQVSVRDTGIGIAKEYQEKIFEAFRQAGEDHNITREGTGPGPYVGAPVRRNARRQNVAGKHAWRGFHVYIQHRGATMSGQLTY